MCPMLYVALIYCIVQHQKTTHDISNRHLLGKPNCIGGRDGIRFQVR